MESVAWKYVSIMKQAALNVGDMLLLVGADCEFLCVFSQARNYISSLPHMPKRNFADVFIGANPQGNTGFSQHRLYCAMLQGPLTAINIYIYFKYSLIVQFSLSNIVLKLWPTLNMTGH